MSFISIKTIKKRDPERGLIEVFAVPAMGLTTPQGKTLIPNPAGQEALIFETLEEAEAAVRRAGFDYEFEGKKTYLLDPAGGKTKTTGTACSLDAAVPILIQRLRDREPTVIANSATALGFLKAYEAMDSLIAILGHEDASVRKAVSEALARLAPHSIPAVRKAFEAARKSTQMNAPYIRLTTLTSLMEMIQIGQGVPVLEQCLPMVLEALEDESWLARAQAAQVAGQLALLQETLQRS
ncbi:MAG TPA: HEAT repeat domain-containing protein [Oculatellaceae cyanobacterium]|jgi:hypothetical protein